MNKMKNLDGRYILIIIVLLVMSATLIVNTYISKMNLDKERKTEVIIANNNITERTVILENMLSYKTVNVNDINVENAYKNMNEIVGKMPTVPIYAGEVINRNRISDYNENIINEDFAIKLDSVDKNLNLVKGSFIDIWKVPTIKGFEIGVKPEIVFNSEYVAEIKNESSLSYDEYLKLSDGEDGTFIPEYVILNLDSKKIEELSNINNNIYFLRVSLHKNNLYYENLKNISEETITEKVMPENQEIEQIEDIMEEVENESN